MKKDDSENRRVSDGGYFHIPPVRRDVSTLRVIARCVTANISGVDWVRIARTEIINTNLLLVYMTGKTTRNF